jgi:Ca2+-binding RTX toxin-like protein
MARPAGPVDNGNTTIEFGNRVVGSAGATRTFRVANVGKAALDLGAVSVPAGFSLIDPLVGSIPVGGIATFTVRMDATSAGTKNGFVSIPSNDPDENPFTFRVVGAIGVENKPLPEITVNAMQHGQLRGVDDGNSSFSFGVVAPNTKFSRVARTFRVANDGDATLTLGKMTVPAGFVVLDGLPASLEPGQTDTLVIAVDSTSKAGNKSGQMSFATNDSNENPFSFSVNATVGTVAATGGKPEITVVTTSGQQIVDGSTSALSFGTVQRDAKAPTRTFRVRNDGSGTLTVGSVSVPSGFVVMDPLVGPIAPGASESFTIGLATASAGNRAGQVSFVTNDSNENPFNFAISGAVNPPAGTGAGPAVTASLSGGTLTVNGTSGLDTITLTSSGSAVSVIGNGRAVAGSPFNGVRRIVVHGFDGDDRIDGSGASIPLSLFGGNGNDALIGGFGVDDLHGEGGNDTLTSTDGVADTLVDGGSGTDTIRKDRVDPWSGT